MASELAGDARTQKQGTEKKTKKHNHRDGDKSVDVTPLPPPDPPIVRGDGDH